MSRCSGIRFIHAGHAAFQQICVQQGLFHPVDVVGNGVQRDFVFLCNAVHAAILTAIGQGEDQFVDHGDLGKAWLALVFPAVAFFQRLQHAAEFLPGNPHQVPVIRFTQVGEVLFGNTPHGNNPLCSE